MSALTRRGFLKVGLAGAALLAVAGLMRPRRPATPLHVLDPADAAIVAALVPVVLDGALPPGGEDRERAVREVVAGFDRAVAGLSPAVRDEVVQLLALLAFAPARFATTGLRVALPEASPAQVEGFLRRWRASRFDLLRAGYQALTQLVQAAWYDNPASWPAIGYPGPPRIGA